MSFAKMILDDFPGPQDVFDASARSSLSRRHDTEDCHQENRTLHEVRLFKDISSPTKKNKSKVTLHNERY
jgi:hypothetical protein